MDKIKSDHIQNGPTRSPVFRYQAAAMELRRSKEQIKKKWESRVREQVSAAQGHSSLALINSLDDFLVELADALESPDPATQIPGKGMSKLHGGERARFSGYFIPQLLKEFSLLRIVINEELSEHEVLTHEVRSFIDARIDAVISIATEEFAAVQHEQLQRALSRMESSNHDLEHFAAIAAHDLKSPLATISGYLSLLEDDFTTQLGAEVRGYVAQMQKTADRMRGLIDRLLDYARLSRVDRPPAPVSMEKVVDEVRQNLHENLERHSAKLICGPLPTVMGYADFLSQLIQNLVANAIKFRGEAPPQVSIRCHEQEGHWLFVVEDNGVGFDSEAEKDIFNLFTRLHGGKTQGAGIGLATCRRVVELHGGEIGAKSKPGHGATFYFTIPKRD